MSLNHMEQAHDVADSYDTAMEKFRATLDDARRHWLAFMLAEYPDQEVLNNAAEAVLDAVGSRAVEVNAIYDGRQVTIASAPSWPRSSVRAHESLCVLTVGLGRPLAIDDIDHDRITEGHAVRKRWGSWASVPLTISGHAVGTICALEDQTRVWNLAEQQAIEKVAAELSARVEAWLALAAD